MREVGRRPLLTPAQEVELAKRAGRPFVLTVLEDLDPTPLEFAGQRLRGERVELVCLDQLAQVGLPHRAAGLGVLDQSLEVLPPQHCLDLERHRPAWVFVTSGGASAGRRSRARSGRLLVEGRVTVRFVRGHLLLPFSAASTRALGHATREIANLRLVWEEVAQRGEEAQRRLSCRR